MTIPVTGGLAKKSSNAKSSRAVVTFPGAGGASTAVGGAGAGARNVAMTSSSPGGKGASMEGKPPCAVHGEPHHKVELNWIEPNKGLAKHGARIQEQ